MKKQNHEIVKNKINEIEPLNEIIDLDLDLESLEAIAGGGCECKGNHIVYHPPKSRQLTSSFDVQSTNQDDQIDKLNL
ncbi:MAG: hypothetical protein QNJ72_16020 [Pleurocapsa sp. MO_226.B13]|nr:hypothetical protein [Pleurocapsa sp. MO_226.B13]